MAAIIVQVVIQQGLHHVFAHDHHGEPCNVEGVHIHSEEHAHFSCDLCLFQFTPSEVVDEEFQAPELLIVTKKLQSEYQRDHYSQRYLQAYLRGPPSYSI